MGHGEGVVELGQDAAPQAHHPHHPVLDAGGRHSLVDGHGHDLLHLVVENEAERVGGVDGEVEDHPGAGGGVVVPPTAPALGQPAGEARPGGHRPADRARAGSGPGFLVGGVAADVVIHAEVHSGGGRRRDHLPGVGYGER